MKQDITIWNCACSYVTASMTSDVSFKLIIREFVTDSKREVTFCYLMFFVLQHVSCLVCLWITDLKTKITFSYSMFFVLHLLPELGVSVSA